MAGEAVPMTDHLRQSGDWKIIAQHGDSVTLGVDEDDDDRLVVNARTGHHYFIYRCATCGWNDACEDGCHA